VEPNETFFVNLSSPTNATISDGQGVGTIVNDDGASHSSIVRAFASAGNLKLRSRHSSSTLKRVGVESLGPLPAPLKSSRALLEQDFDSAAEGLAAMIQVQRGKSDLSSRSSACV
jgi:hypothetical protein